MHIEIEKTERDYIMMLTKHTTESKSAFFAVADIEARARKAYRDNRSLFDSAEHKARCDRVEDLLKHMLADYDSIYHTARAKTKRRAAHTEVKVQRAIQHTSSKHTELRTQTVSQLAMMGLDLVYKPRTNSYSVHVL